MNGDQPNPTNPAPVTPAPVVVGGAATPQPAAQPVQPAQPAPAASQKPVVIDKIKNGANILIAISADPSIDQLAAAIGLTLLLEKYNKNVTAVFSGKVPSALEYLKPGEHFQKSTDSLRDFIIAIDKSKADKLRYKVEDNVVKIFITPYRTTITPKDLQFNAGEFNIDVIVALGVQHQQDLDTAITAHGRIFHDAVVVSINNQAGGDFGIAHWENTEVSSLSEMVAHMAVDLGQNQFDADIATALLTGIVAETNRFSNAKTHPGTMEVSSALLQAGADQQLVNQQLQSIIGTEVNLTAGAEIKPTMTADELKEQFPHEDEELIIGNDGSLKPAGKSDDEKPTDEKPADDKAEQPDDKEKPADDKLADNKTAETDDKPTPPKPSDEKPAEDKPESADKESEPEHKPEAPIEPDLVLPTEAEEPKEPVIAEEPPKPTEDAPKESTEASQAEAARKAVTEALKNAAAEAETIPAIKVVEPPALPDATPLTQPGPGQVPTAAPSVEAAPIAPVTPLTETPPVVMSPTAPAPGAPVAPPLPPPIPPPIAPPSAS